MDGFDDSVASNTNVFEYQQLQRTDVHMLCQVGNLWEIKEFVKRIDEKSLADKLASKKGKFGHTPIHEAVISGKANVLDYLLEKTNNVHVNCQAKNGYTPLHLATSLGREDCVRTLLRHNADISITDERGKVPKQTAESRRKIRIAKLLRGEGKLFCNIIIICS